RAREGVGAAVANGSNPLLPENARQILDPSAQLAVPVIEKGRAVLVFVAERVGSAETWTDEEVAFAEHVVARAATAYEQVARLDSLTQQVTHTRLEVEQMAD